MGTSESETETDLSAKPSFDDAGRKGEKHIPAQTGLRRIVVGKAFLIADPVSEGPPPEETIPEEKRPAEIDALAEGLRRAEGTYHKRKSKGNTLALEKRDDFAEMLEAEIAILSQVKERHQEKLEEEIRQGKPARRAVYDLLQERIDRFSTVLSVLEAAPPEERNVNQIENFMQQRETLSSVQRALLSALEPTAQPSEIEDVPAGYIPVMQSVPVGDLVYFRHADGCSGARIPGAVTWSGVDQDHANIMARTSGIVIARIPRHEADAIRHGDDIIIDGLNGKIILNPTPETIIDYEREQEKQNARNQELLKQARTNAGQRTKDGHTLKISSSIGSIDEVNEAMEVCAPVGLYRTEFVVTDFLKLPDRGKWYRIFKALAEKSVDARGRIQPVTLRTADFEGDKIIASLKNDPDRQKKIARDQMAALLEVSRDMPEAELHMMVPVIRDAEHFKEMQTMMNEAAEELGLPPKKLGMMVEKISVIPQLGQIDAEFLSIGTNDLIPSILGYDRQDQDNAHLYDPTHPAVLKALSDIREHEKKSKPVSICGDIATDPRYFALLVGLGFQHISTGVTMVPTLKKLRSRRDVGAAEKLVAKLRETETRAERERLLDEYNEQYLGLLPNGALKSHEEDQDAAPSADCES